MVLFLWEIIGAMSKRDLIFGLWYESDNHFSQVALLLGGDPVVKMSGKNLPLLPPSPSPKRTKQR